MTGKFSHHPLLTFITRWNVALHEDMSFVDPAHGVLTVPANFEMACVRRFSMIIFTK